MTEIVLLMSIVSSLFFFIKLCILNNIYMPIPEIIAKWTISISRDKLMYRFDNNKTELASNYCTNKTFHEESMGVIKYWECVMVQSI